ncbi:hypothetical protein C8R45DRAFT_931242 [Mycena sanguinolenta]|nr:hypothetical protein C8R45DRAFT_931242 [Mycena sanguinolenta]
MTSRVPVEKDNLLRCGTEQSTSSHNQVLFGTSTKTDKSSVSMLAGASVVDCSFHAAKLKASSILSLPSSSWPNATVGVPSEIQSTRAPHGQSERGADHKLFKLHQCQCLVWLQQCYSFIQDTTQDPDWRFCQLKIAPHHIHKAPQDIWLSLTTKQQGRQGHRTVHCCHPSAATRCYQSHAEQLLAVYSGSLPCRLWSHRCLPKPPFRASMCVPANSRFSMAKQDRMKRD